jgi:hypothetical protein
MFKPAEINASGVRMGANCVQHAEAAVDALLDSAG